MHATGVGKVLLADAPQPVQSAVLADLRAVTPQTIVDPVRMRQQLAEVRTRGFARTLDEMTVGTASMAVPVRDAWGVTRAALGVVVTNTRRDPTRQLPALQDAARGIGRQPAAGAARVARPAQAEVAGPSWDDTAHVLHVTLSRAPGGR